MDFDWFRLVWFRDSNSFCLSLSLSLCSATIIPKYTHCIHIQNDKTNLSAQQALDLIDEIDESNVVVHLDIYHMNIEEVDLVSPVVACSKANKLGYVHIGASHRGSLLDGGNIHFESFFDALAKAKYRGIITFESFSSAVIDENLTNALAIWRNTWTDNMKLAKDAHDYISNQIQQAHNNNSNHIEKHEE